MTPSDQSFLPSGNDSETDPFTMSHLSIGRPTTKSLSGTADGADDASFDFGSSFQEQQGKESTSSADMEMSAAATTSRPAQSSSQEDFDRTSVCSPNAMHRSNMNTSGGPSETRSSERKHPTGLSQSVPQGLGGSAFKRDASPLTMRISPASSSTTVSELSARFGSSNVDKNSRQSMLARLYQSRSVRRRQAQSSKTENDDSPEKASPSMLPKLVGSKRAFSDDEEGACHVSHPFEAQGENPQSPGTPSANVAHTVHPEGNSGTMQGESLLHNSCKLYPTTTSVIESALQLDPESIRRPVPVESSRETNSSKHKILKRRRTSETFSYPINIALWHDGSNAVLELLCKAGPDVLVQYDGSCQSSSLAIALRLEKDISVIKIILDANPKQTQVMDLQEHAYPLHVAARLRTVTLDLVKLIYHAFPAALHETNVRGETPVQVAERNPYCKEEILNFLQDFAYSPAEMNADHIEDSLLEQPESFL